MIYDNFVKAAKGEITRFENIENLVKGVNDYRDKIVHSCFENGSIPHNEFPFFVAALNLVIEDIEKIVKQDGEYGRFNPAVTAITEFVRKCTLTVSVKSKGGNNGNSI